MGGSYVSVSSNSQLLGSTNINNMTYGRDSSGRKKLLTDYQNDIKTAIKTLEDESSKVVLTIRNNWAGADADKFVKLFNSDVNELKTLFKSYSSLIQNALDADAKQFSQNQQTLANRIGK
jgi:hypothetical protein